MDMVGFERLIDEFIGECVERVELSFYGEPLLDPDVVAKVSYIRMALGSCMKVGMFSNGSLMDDYMAEALLDAGLSYICFSVDGITAKSYEHVRQGLQYDAVIDNIKGFIQHNEARGHPCTIRLHMTATAETRNDVREFRRRWLATPGVDLASWLPCDGRAGVGKEPLLIDRSSNEPCQWMNFALNVLTDGTVVMCCLDYKGRVPLGNVFAQDVRAVWEGDIIESVRELHRSGRKYEIPMCAECKTRY